MSPSMSPSIHSQPAHVRRALGALRARLEQRWGDALIAMRLFGSRVRGEASAESDVDVCVVLERAGWDERRATIDAAADVGLEHELVISATVFDRATYERWREQGRPLVADIEREGIPL